MSQPVHVVCPHCVTTNRVPDTRLTEQPICGHCRKPLFNRHPLTLTGANFDRHLKVDDLPLVVDFWAPWCGPCRAMAPAFEQAAAQLEPHFRLGKLNTDDEVEIAGRYGIRSIPTLIVFKLGREVARQAGAMPAAGMMQWIRQAG
jgi:thioredoxin 2